MSDPSLNEDTEPTLSPPDDPDTMPRNAAPPSGAAADASAPTASLPTVPKPPRPSPAPEQKKARPEPPPSGEPAVADPLPSSPLSAHPAAPPPAARRSVLPPPPLPPSSMKRPSSVPPPLPAAGSPRPPLETIPSMRAGVGAQRRGRLDTVPAMPAAPATAAARPEGAPAPSATPRIASLPAGTTVAAAPSSVPPMALSDSWVPPAMPAQRGMPLWITMGAMICAGIALAAFAVVVPRALASMGAEEGHGSLVVTATAPHGTTVDRVEVFVDDTSLCTQTPCRVKSLSAGGHVVRIAAPGFKNIAERGVAVRKDEEATVQFALVPLAQKAPAANADSPSNPPAAEPRRAAASKGAKGRAGVAKKPAAAAVHPPPADAPKKATLMIRSAEASNVIVDGHPVGKTPIGVRVKPGEHRVTLATPEGKRRVLTVKLLAGETRTLSVGN